MKLRYFLWVLPLAGIAIMQSFQGTARPRPLSATYSQGTLHTTIPYRIPEAGPGVLSVEILDPEDGVLGRVEHTVDATAQGGSWTEDIRLTKATTSDDLAWHRMRYQFVRKGRTEAEGIETLQAFLRTPVLRILGQQAYLAGGQAAVRAIVTDTANEPVAGVSNLRIEMGQRLLFAGRLNARGTAEAQFRLPAGVSGTQPLHYVVDTPIGTTEYTQQIRIEEKSSILLTTEKPIYQPGQTIHVRVLALDRGSHQATAGHKLTLELEDSKGNKVFKKAAQTDQFGVASAEFGLADEVNLGTYHLRAGDGGANSAELAVNVERYVLPKFKVAVEFTGQGKHGYRPGDHVTGIVRANYFFGKPVDRSEITVKATGIDVEQFDAGSVTGRTDAEGTYKFDIALPKFFAGKPLANGAARVLLEATVKDNAGHAETRGEPVTVSESPLIVTAVPEGGTLIPGLENQVFVLTSYADGKPAKTSVRVNVSGWPDQTASTDEGGVAVIRINGSPSLAIVAADSEGNRVSTNVVLGQRYGDDQILLRTEKAVYKPGDRIRLQVFATRKTGAAYIDVVREGQTVLTRDVDLNEGRGELLLTATPDLAGTLDFNAYLFGANARPVADHRLAFVEPADELKIETTASAGSYKPGDDARVQFRVTNSRGEGVQAALGVQVVDEAVFALAEKQPGFAKVFFYLEQEALKPRYEIHAIGMPEIVEPVPLARVEQRDRAARALFAATEMVSRNKFQTEVGRTVGAAKAADYARRYDASFAARSSHLAKILSEYYQQNPNGGELPQVLASLDVPEARDAWNMPVVAEKLPWGQGRLYYILHSAGADRKFGTSDDLRAYYEHKAKTAAQPETQGAKLEIDTEHDRGPFNGLAEVTGVVRDPSDAVIAQAAVTLRETASGKTRNAITDATGRFTFAGVAPGDYSLDVSSPGFRSAQATLFLRARDRAVAKAALNVSAVFEQVTVMADSVLLQTQSGVMGGVVGGVPGMGVGMGGGFAGGNMRVEGRPMAMQMAAGPVAASVTLFESMGVSTKADTFNRADAGPAARVRSYFPEALYINPEIVTGRDGRASIVIPIADSITTWRMALMASTTQGALGSATSSIKVFQDFFVDLDLPVKLTQGDRVSIPVAIYNYSAAGGDVKLELKQEDWFQLVQDTAAKTVAVESGRVGGAQFTIEAKRIGKFKLTLSAGMKGGADIVVREIEVAPDGRQLTQVFNGRLENAVQHDVKFPPTAVPDAEKIFVRLYPGPLSQVIEGMDAILRMPGGCFEQTSSSTYPNVLALDYMKRTKKLTPEVRAKAEGFIANGYQRLLTFEVPGGGFSWFGNPPANKILTAYGLMEFYDMAQVYEVDPRLIERTQQWLAGQQQGDGSWKPDTQFINEGATNRFNTDTLRITAYIAWALDSTGFKGPAVDRAREYIARNNNAKPDTYTLAVLANFASTAKDREVTRQAMQALIDARTDRDDMTWWDAQETGVYATGSSAAVETTGLAVQALLKWGQGSGVAGKALKYIASKKDSTGAWGTTQATIMALRAVLLSASKGTADVRGAVEISLNGSPVERLTLTQDNNDLFHQFVLKNVRGTGSNVVDLKFTGQGSLAYQVTGDYFVPWTEKPAGEPLSISVNYDRSQLAENDIATATATVRNNLAKTAKMIMVDLGIPPGFELLSEDLQSFQEKSAARKSGRLEKFSLTATQAILYFDSLSAGETVKLPFRLRAKYPIRTRTFQSRVYEYYDPEVSSLARPQILEVRKK